MAPLHGRMIDAWMQHPTARFRAQPMFDPLRRWLPTANLAARGHPNGGNAAQARPRGRRGRTVRVGDIRHLVRRSPATRGKRLTPVVVVLSSSCCRSFAE